uniref:Uncharacterized protein n=1 Tax=Anguilla anguilla TaxID=7936 RepID=A0A0E9P7F0_ANGAN
MQRVAQRSGKCRCLWESGQTGRSSASKKLITEHFLFPTKGRITYSIRQTRGHCSQTRRSDL